METFKRSHCFFCLSEDSEEAVERKEEVVKAFKTSCQYLIDKDEVRKGLLRLFEDDQGKTEGLKVVLCGSCGEVAESVQELHLELEEIRRRLLGRVKVLQDIVVQNSRLYGTNGRAKKSLEELEEWVDAQEKLGRRSVETEKRFLKLLHVFQTLVFEKDVDVGKSPELCSTGSTSDEEAKSLAEDEIKVEVDPDEILSEEMEETLDIKEELEEQDVEDIDDLKLVPSPSSFVSSEDKVGRRVSSGKKQSKKVRRNPRKTSRRKRYVKSNSSRSKLSKGETTADKQLSRGTFSCDLCPKEYLRKTDLSRHKQRVHGILVPKTFECDQCHKILANSSTLSKHRLIHKEGKKHICDTCGYATNYMLIFKNHLLTHEGVLNYFCSHCPKAFCNELQLKNHLRYHSDPGDKLNCDLCDFVGLHRYSIYNHMKTVHGPPTMPPPNASYAKFECSTCHAKFTTKERFFTHRAAEHDEKPYACTMCEATFSTSISLLMHRKKQHMYLPNESSGDFKCDQCSARLSTKRGLSHHIRRSHSLIAPKQSFSCDTCPLVFSHLISLRFHKRTKHGAPIPKRERTTFERRADSDKFGCDKCTATFTKKENLKVHKMAKHYEGSETGKKLKCETCGLESTHLLSFRLHLKSHDEAAKIFVCDQCPKKFAQRRLLEQHLYTHSTVNQYRCEVCNSTFRHAASLWDHKRKKHNNST